MMPKNSGIHELEGRVRREEPEYVELDELDLIYERTGTLCFPSRLMEINGRAAAAAGAGRDMTRAPSVRPVPPASRHAGPSRGGEVRSFAPMGVPQRTTQPSLRAKQRARRVYPSFGQRVLAEVRRLRFAKRSVVLAGVAAVAAAGAFVASSALVPRRAPREAAPTHPSPAAVVVAERSAAERRAAERAPVPAPAHVGPRVSVLTEEYEAALDRPALDRPALDAPLTDAHSNGAKATAGAKPRAPERSRPHEPCDCLPGDPLCGCLD